MRSKILLAGTAFAALAIASTAVLAADNNAQAGQVNLRNHLTQMLQKSGYTDIRMAPSSFVVRAKDESGNPVVMSISPDQFTEVTTVGDATGNAPNHERMTTATDGTASFVNVPGGDDLSSRVVGLDIYNNDNKDIGTVKDIAFNPNGREAAYIVSVGGFLGIGEHYVAISPSAVKVSYNDGDKKWHATMNASADQLKNAPEFKYAGRWASGKT